MFRNVLLSSGYYRLVQILLFIAVVYMIQGCEERRHPQTKSEKAPFIRYRVESYRQTLDILDRLGYSEAAFKKGMKEIPPVILTKISNRWRKEARTLPLSLKKSLFLRLMASGALIADAEVARKRKKLLQILAKMPKGGITPKESRWLRRLALEYGVLKHPDDPFTPADLRTLKRRVDIVPASMIVAQSAIESAWGTSRFAREGNALFGQWAYGPKTIRPKDPRPQLGDYGLRRFKTPLDSIRAYIHNLNTYPAYRAFRDLRAKLRAEGKPLTGIRLVQTLDHYSEEGDAYIQKVIRLIKANRLQWLDFAKLKKMKPIYIYPNR